MEDSNVQSDSTEKIANYSPSAEVLRGNRKAAKNLGEVAPTQPSLRNEHRTTDDTAESGGRIITGRDMPPVNSGGKPTEIKAPENTPGIPESSTILGGAIKSGLTLGDQARLNQPKNPSIDNAPREDGNTIQMDLLNGRAW